MSNHSVDAGNTGGMAGPAGRRAEMRGPLLAFIAGFGIFLGLFLILVGVSRADVVTLRPDGVVSAGTWTGVTAPNLNDQSDATFASITNAVSTFRVSLANDAVYAGATINSVTVYVRAQVSGGGGAGERLDFGPAGALSGSPVTISRTALTNYSFTPGTAFTPATIDSLEIEVATTTIGAGETMRAAEVWAVVDYTPTAGNNQVNSCDGCHDQPPVEGGSRTGTTGAVVGSHNRHAVYACTVCHPNNAVLNHRGGGTPNGTEGRIEMLANIEGGSYSKGAAFNQTNDLTGTGLGSCSDVACHGGASSVTPQWGASGGIGCDGCHALPPATNAHPEHYAAKGWTAGTTTNCITCHPDNTAGHSDVSDGVVALNAGLSPSGVSPAISCGTAPELGCHNGKTTPQWSTATPITCTNCHTTGGANIADPQTGLHNMTVAGVQKHDASISGGCQACHVTKAATHADGNFNPNSNGNTDRFVTRTSMTWTDAAVNAGTCSGTGLSGCHSDGGAWSRLWSTAANSTATAVGDPRCAVCHGQFGNWRLGTSHGATFGTTTSTRGQSHNSVGGGTNACEDCHSYPSVAGRHDTATHLITMNEGTWVATRVSGRTYCSSCHTNDGDFAVSGTHTFKTSVFTKESVSGGNDPVGSCTGCHGGGTSGASSANFWPDGSNANPENTGGSNKHLIHLTRLAAKRYGETIAQLLTDNGNGTSDVKQKTLCDYCHRTSAQDATHRDGTTQVFPAGYNKTLWNTADGGTAASYSAAADTCSNVDCHNSKLTTDGTFGWYDTGTSTCLMCHTVGAAGGNPTTGLHNTTAGSMVTGKRHDDTLKPASGCAACHGMPAIGNTVASTHINGTFTADSGTNTDRGLTGLYSDAAANAGTCSGGIAGAAGCHDGGGDAGTWKRKWSNTADDGGTAPCANCHGGFGASDWTFGADNVVGDGSTSHLRNWDADGSSEVIGNHPDSTNKCATCHVYPNSPYSSTWGTGNHGNDKIDLNSTVGYDQAAWNCTSACHAGAANTNHNLEDSGWTVQAVAGPGLSCTGCHGASSPAAGVGTSSPHVQVSRTGGTVKCENCHPGGTKGAMHSIGAGVVGIANNAAAGINYTHDVDPGGATLLGFALGGDATTGTTEAEICWNCHFTLSPIASEWGTNTGGTYNYGSLHSTAGDATPSPGNHLNWTTGFWKSANFSYKNGPLANKPNRTSANPGTAGAGSIHATGGTVGTQSNTLSLVRCSYCHDVHNTKAGSPNGAPYLRGTWRSSPYKEDGAPRAGVTYNGGQSKFGNVPRGSTTTTGAGGFQIDQNNANPNSTYTYATNDGLCNSCHTQATLETAWVGHKNAVRGFTNDTSAARNIFSVASRNMQNNRTTRPYMAYQGVTGYLNSDWMGGFRSSDYASNANSLTTIPVNGRYGYQAGNFQWGTQGTGLTNLDISSSGTAVNADYHSFSCSKCHNPHASRLPRLMITNCLDTQLNTWDDQYASDPKWSNWTTDVTGLKQLAYTTSAQNCHRRIDANGDGDTADTGEAPGWNAVTPW